MQTKGKIPERLINLIKSKLDECIPILQISKMLHVSRPAIYRIKKDMKYKRSGPKPKFDKKKLEFQMIRAIKAFNNKGMKVTASKIAGYISEPVKLRTLQRELKKSPLVRLRKTQKKIMLNESQKRNRLETLRSWFEQEIDFFTVIFSDESRFSLDGPDNDTSWQLLEGDAIYRPCRPMGGGSIMVFGVIGCDGFLSIRQIDGTLNGEKYAQLMDEDILPMLKRRYKSKFIFQQDNARPHTCKKAIDVFTKHCIKLLKWPPHSPDLSLIENIWHIIKVQVYDGQIFQNKYELWDKITVVVASINKDKPSKVKALYSSLIKRYLDVIEKHGDNI